MIIPVADGQLLVLIYFDARLAASNQPLPVLWIRSLQRHLVALSDYLVAILTYSKTQFWLELILPFENCLSADGYDSSLG